MSEPLLSENHDAIRINAAPTKKEKKVKKATPNGGEAPPGDKLTEKQLRKLEWEKRLAEEKLKVQGEETLSKAELKAKRREQQEAQRQIKTEKTKPAVSMQPAQKPPLKATKEVVGKPPETEPKLPQQQDNKKHSLKKPQTNPKHVQLVKHLYRTPCIASSRVVNFKEVHPVFVKLGVQYSEKVVLGSNARALALLAAIQCLIRDAQVPPKEEFCRYLENVLQKCTNYLQECRPFAMSMTNALRAFKMRLQQVDSGLPDNTKRASLLDFVETYIKNDVMKAWDAICIKVNEKIVDGDVILIYGCSSLVRKILMEAAKSGKEFSVVIVDSRPLFEGREMLRRLVGAGIKCSYLLINGLNWVMKRTTKVLLGAHALLANGSVMSRIGTAQVALVAQTYNKPVLVCCETYKFSERVQTDSFVYNEIGDPDLLLSVDTATAPSPLIGQKDNSKLNILNLLYDVTPPDLVTAVVTELAILPCTSVPVVLRINAGENNV